MTSTANELSWIKEADAPVSTYRAEANGWKYAADQPSKGRWVLRGWGPDGLFLYREDTTLKGAKAQAVDHQADQAKAAAAVTSLAAKLKPTFIALDEGMQVIGRAIGPATGALRELVAALRISQPCGCPTPTHRMSCGTGAVPRVRPTVQRSGRMSIRQPELTAFPRKDRAL